jgi:CO/xanthine dehydrogenase Mo-binding subunit
MKHRVVGRPVPRDDGIARATGRTKFVADLSFPGMLIAAVVRSPYPHARIVSVDVAEAVAVPGVAAICTARDIPGRNVVHVVNDDQPLLADGVVRYIGEPVAVVAADSAAAARRGADAVRVEYEELSVLLDMEIAQGNPVRVCGEDNLVGEHRIVRGDVDSAFERDDVITVSGEFRTPHQEHAYIEPQGIVAVPEPDGMTAYGSMQCPFYVQLAVAETLGLPLARVRVVQTATGGAFGGKEDFPSLVAGHAAIVAHATGRPVRLIYDRHEDVAVSSKRHPSVVRIKMAATADGEFVACESDVLLNGGAYTTLSSVVLWRSTVHAAGPYRWPNVRVHSRAVATNTVPNGAFRGFGSPQSLFAVESLVDILSEKLRIDPLELREKNILRVGDRTATGQLLDHSVGLGECVERVRSAYEDTKKRTSKSQGTVRRGTGVSVVYYGVGLGAGGRPLAKTGAYVHVAKDGSCSAAVGTTDMGQGMRTVLAQIVAEELGLDYEAVSVLPTDTSRVPDSGPTVASRATTMSGNALRDACAEIRQSLAAAVAERFLCDLDLVELRGAEFIAHDGRTAAVADAIKWAHDDRRHTAASGFCVSPATSFDPETGQGDAYVVYAYAANVAEVEVDIETGVVRVVRVTAAHDVGKAINPQLVEGQIEGGTVQGCGFARFEELLLEEGNVINPSFSTYTIPTSVDAPIVSSIIVEHAYRDGPYGAKGFGEQPLMGIAPAVANAVFDAVGVRLRELPLTPERVSEALRESGDD